MCLIYQTGASKSRIQTSCGSPKMFSRYQRNICILIDINLKIIAYGKGIFYRVESVLVLKKNSVRIFTFSDVRPCRVVSNYQRFGEMCCIRLSFQIDHYTSPGNYLTVCTAQRLKRLESSVAPLLSNSHTAKNCRSLG
jgi:hypothetical protein